MGVVYKARQSKAGRLVALKLLRKDDPGGGEMSRFRLEAEAMARLQHPGIVQVFEVGECDGRPFFSMELCSAGSLDKYLDCTPLSAQGSGPPHRDAGRSGAGRPRPTHPAPRSEAGQRAAVRRGVFRDAPPDSVGAGRPRLGLAECSSRSANSASPRSSTRAARDRRPVAILGTPPTWLRSRLAGQQTGGADGGRLWPWGPSSTSASPVDHRSRRPTTSIPYSWSWRKSRAADPLAAQNAPRSRDGVPEMSAQGAGAAATPTGPGSGRRTGPFPAG